MKSFQILFLICAILFATENVVAQKINKSKRLGSYVFEQNGKKLNANALLQALSSNKNAYNLASSGKGQYNLGNVLGAIGGFGIGWPIGSALGGGEPNWLMAGGGLVLAIAGITVNNKGAQKFSQAIDMYNSELGFNSYKSKKYYVSPSKTGIGLAFNF